MSRLLVIVPANSRLVPGAYAAHWCPMQNEAGGDLELPIVWLFALMAGRLHRRVSDRLSRLGLSQAEFGCMRLLAATPGLSNSELARRAGVSRQSMWETVQSLEDTGLATRPRSNYARPAALSRRGRRYLRQAQREIATAEKAATANLTAQERTQLTSLLMQLSSTRCTTNSNERCS